MLVLPIQAQVPKPLFSINNFFGWSNYVWSRELGFGENERDKVFSLGVDNRLAQFLFDPDVDDFPGHPGTDEWTFAYFRFLQPLLGPQFIFDSVVSTGGGPPVGCTIYAIPADTIDWDPQTLTWNNQPASPGLLADASIYPAFQMMNNAMPGPEFVGHLGPGTEIASMSQRVFWDLSGFGRPIIGFVAIPYINGSSGSVQHGMQVFNIAILDRGIIPHRFINVVSRSAKKMDPVVSNDPTQTLTLAEKHHFFVTPVINPSFIHGTLLSIKGVDARYDSFENNFQLSFGPGQTRLVQVVDEFSLKFLTQTSPHALVAPFNEPITPCKGMVEIWGSGY